MDASFTQGDVVLVEFPYSDRSGSKLRPAIVISTDAYHAGRDDVIVVAVTSKKPPVPRPTDYQLQDWLVEGLDKESWVRAQVATVNKTSIQRIGALTERDLREIKSCLRKAFGL